MTLWQENRQRLVALVDQQLASHDEHVGEFDNQTYTEWRQRRGEADRAMVTFFVDEADARFTYRPPRDHKVKMAGILSSSTSGYRGPLHNWRRAALKKLGAAA